MVEALEHGDIGIKSFKVTGAIASSSTRKLDVAENDVLWAGHLLPLVRQNTSTCTTTRSDITTKIAKPSIA
jgi:hypothetical protein